MTSDFEDRLMRLEGHVAALGLLSRIAMTAICNGQDRDPLTVIDEIERETLSTLQFGDRPIGEPADQIWEYAIGSLTIEFENIRGRLACSETGRSG